VDDLLKHALELHAKQSEASLMLLGCILHTILDEFQHLHQYPDSELKLTAAVYGGLIRVDFFDRSLLAEGMQKLLVGHFPPRTCLPTILSLSPGEGEWGCA
jgi:hypothetical protein